LDELPQLINVLRGEMSLVGPRPEVVEKVEQFDAEARRTLEVRPGITDWASIWNSDEGGVLTGAMDPDAAYEEIIRPVKRQLQLYYLETHSLRGDLKIILYTILRIVRKNWCPRELQGYPTFAELRAQAVQWIAEEQARTPTNP